MREEYNELGRSGEIERVSVLKLQLASCHKHTS